MNPLELGAQKIIIAILQEIQAHHLEIARLVTLGKVSDQKLNDIDSSIRHALSLLEPLIDEADTLIPSTMPILKDVLDWCKDIIQSIDK